MVKLEDLSNIVAPQNQSFFYNDGTLTINKDMVIIGSKNVEENTTLLLKNVSMFQKHNIYL